MRDSDGAVRMAQCWDLRYGNLSLQPLAVSAGAGDWLRCLVGDQSIVGAGTAASVSAQQAAFCCVGYRQIRMVISICECVQM